MATISQLDKFYNNFPSLSREAGFDNFWKTGINQIRNISMQPEITKNKRKSSARFTVYDVIFKGFEKVSVYGQLYIPINISKPRPIILLHDYNKEMLYNKYGLLEDYAYFFLKLRGHNIINFSQKDVQQNQSNIPETPEYLTENILYPDKYYLKGMFLDVYRSIDFLRLQKQINCDNITIIAKGISASAALFTAAYNKRVKNLYLDSPGFIDLENFHNLSKSDATKEIHNYISSNRKIKSIIKKNLTYFDGVNFADKFDGNLLFSTGLKDTVSPPKCVLGLFHKLNCDKTIEIYPDESNECGASLQFAKALNWIKSCSY